MRNFDDYEKGILKLITSKQSISNMIEVSDLYENIARESDVQIRIDNENKRIEIVSDKKVKALPISEVDKPTSLDEGVYKVFMKGALTTASLLDYLVKNGLIYFYKISVLSVKSGSSAILNHTKILQPNAAFKVGYINEELELLLYENIDKSIFATPELIKFVQHNFKDDEQIRHNESIAVAKTLGYISIGIALISIIPESCSQQLFNFSKNKVSEEQHSNTSHNDTIMGNQKTTDIKGSSFKSEPNYRSILPDTLKK